MNSNQTTTESLASAPLKASRRLHPEDLAAGDYVAVAHVTLQFPTFLWCGADPVTLPPDKPVQITFLPHADKGPLKVTSICLPFVLCKNIEGDSKMFDLREVQFLRLDSEFGKVAQKALSKKSRNGKTKSADRKSKKRKSQDKRD